MRSILYSDESSNQQQQYSLVKKEFLNAQKKEEIYCYGASAISKCPSENMHRRKLFRSNSIFAK